MIKKAAEATPEKTVSQVTRRGIMDYLGVNRNWAGALEQDEFLKRLYPLDEMHSTDYRMEYNTAALDIWQHMVRNRDWSDDWVFTDGRFNLLHGPGITFLAFLAETVHPIVRPDTEEAEAMVAEYNQVLAVDGWEIYKHHEISGKPVFSYRTLSLSSIGDLEAVESVAERLSGTYVGQQISRLRSAVDKDPAATIGNAKEFLETVCKTILAERGIELNGDPDLPALVKQTAKNLQLVPPGVASDPKGATAVAGLLSSLAAVGQQVGEVRNKFGTGHGKVAKHQGLDARHARLVLGATSTLALFLYDCHESQPVKPRG